MKVFVAAALLAALVATSAARNALWHDDGSIWAATLRRFPNKARGYNELGLYLMSEGRYGDAYQCLSTSLRLNPYQPQIWNNLGQALENLGRIDDAIDIYTRAMGYAPDDPAPYYNLGLLYHDRLGQRDRALRYFLRARDLNPLEPDIHFQLSRVYEELGERMRSAEELERYEYLKR